MTPRKLEIPLDAVEIPDGASATHIEAANRKNLARVGAGVSCKQIDLSHTPIRTLPQIKAELRITLAGCHQLESLPDHLTTGVLTLTECARLKRLPEHLSVAFLDLEGCSALEALPETLRMQGGRLRLRGLHRLKRLPEQLGGLSQLDLSGCASIEEIPESVKVASWIDVGRSGVTRMPDHLRGIGLRWQGVPVSERVAFHPETLSASEILAERNAEVRRVMVERFGLDRFLEDANAQTLDVDRDAGGERKLLRVELDEDEPLVCVSVFCPSTGRHYFLRVPPTTKTCLEAVAWTANLAPKAYRPLLET
jgi:hypothetical protein